MGKKQARSYSSLGHKMWTRIRKVSGNRTRLPKACNSNLIQDTTCPNSTAHGGSETCRAVTLHKQLYTTAVQNISEESPTLPQCAPEDNFGQATVSSATPESIHLFEDLHAVFFFVKCLSALCTTREPSGKTTSESNLSTIMTWDNSKMTKSSSTAHKVSLQGKDTSAFRLLALQSSLYFFLFCICLYINTQAFMCIFLCLVHTEKHRNLLASSPFLIHKYADKIAYKKSLTMDLVLVLSFKLVSRKKYPYTYTHIYIHTYAQTQACAQIKER